MQAVTYLKKKWNSVISFGYEFVGRVKEAEKVNIDAPRQHSIGDIIPRVVVLLCGDLYSRRIQSGYSLETSIC